MNTNKQSINVSILGGWGAINFDVSSGVVDAGGRVVQVQSDGCHVCEKIFKVGDSVAIVRMDDATQSERVYHMDCLPSEFSFAFPTLARALFR